MNIFSKQRFMLLALVLLAILNLFTLSFIWFRMQRPAPPPKRPEDQEQVIRLLKDELNLNDLQVEAFLQQRRAFQTASRHVLDTLHVLKQAMFAELFKEQPDSVRVDHLIRQIGEQEKAKERLTFEHFAKLKELLGDQQQDRLQRLLEDFYRRSNAPQPPRRRPPGDSSNRPPR